MLSEVYLIVRKILNNNNEEVVLDAFFECFLSYEDAVSYLKTHYRAKKVNKQDKFATKDFVYNIKKISIIKEYVECNDQLILMGGE